MLLRGPGNKATGFRTLGSPGASAGSLVGRVRVRRTPGLLPAPWRVKPGPEVTVGLLAGRASSWSLTAGSRDPRACFRSLVGGEVAISDTVGMGSGVS